MARRSPKPKFIGVSSLNEDCTLYDVTSKGNVIGNKWSGQAEALSIDGQLGSSLFPMKNQKKQALEGLSSNLRFDPFNFVSGLHYVTNHIFDRRHFLIIFQD